MISPQDRKRLKEAFNEWAKNVPNPDEPAMGFVGTKIYSAREMAREVANETPVGKDVLSMLEYGVEVEGIDKVVERLTRKTGALPAP